MKYLARYKGMRPLIWFTAALLLFLAVGVTLSISRQRTLLLKQITAHMDREFSLIEAVISDDLLMQNYSRIERYITLFALQYPEIYSVRAVASNGFVLAQYVRDRPTDRPLTREYCIDRGDRTCLVLELTHDLEPDYITLAALTREYVLASAVFALSMAAFLWYVLRKKAFIPLENALMRLNTANTSLEERVAERTAEWVRANTELKNEIIEREAVEQELVIRERAIAGSMSGIVFNDFDLKITYANSSILSMYGYSDPGEVIGRSGLEFWGSREDAETALQQLRSSGFWFGEVVAKRKDGTFFDAQVLADIVKDSNGRPICIMGSVLDITERKRADADLRKEKDFTTAVLNTVGAIVVVLDHEGRIIRFNRACEQLSGYAFEEVEGKFIWDIFLSPEQVEPVMAVFQMLTSGRFPTRYENYWIAKDGAKRMIAWSNTCLTDQAGRVTHVIATGIDITENRRTTGELAKSEAKHRMVVENISEIIYSMSLVAGRLRGDIDFLGGSVQQTTGFTGSDFLQAPALWLDLIHPDDLASVKEATRRMVRDRAETTRLYRLRHRVTGNYVWMEDRMVPRLDKQGTVAGYFGVARDVTRRKQAEDALKGALERAEEEKNKSEAVIAAIGDGISIHDRDFRIVYQNIHQREMIGDHVGEHCYQAYQGRDTVCPECPIAKSFADGKIHVIEQPGVSEKGPLLVEITASPLRDASGSIVAGLEVVRNITDRKKAEIDLRRAYETQSIINALLRVPLEGKSMEDVLQRALDIILSSSWYVSQSKGIILLNEDGGELVLKVQRGINAQLRDACARVAPGKCLCGLAAQSGRIQFASHLDERHEVRFESMQPHGHYCVPVTASGRNLGVLSLYLNDGHPYDVYEEEFLTAVANALAGIIQRKRMEEERERMIVDLQRLLDTVSASRLEWQRTFDSITDMISIHDEDCNIIKANKAFVQRFGLEPRDVLKRKCRDLFHGMRPPAADCPHKKTIERQGPVIEEVTDPSTGSIYLVSAFPVSSAETGARGVVHIVRDITAAKENEMRLIMSERLAALGQMASGIAHEINNPLTAIAGCVDGMSRRIGRGEHDQELFKKYLSIIKEEVGRTKNITTSMLSIVQKKDYEKKRLNIHNTLQKSLEVIEYQGRLKNVEVRKRLAEGMPAVYGSEGELKQVFLIIITNALDAMDGKGVLSLESAANDGTAVIAIGDSGPGIPLEIAAKIFDPFFTTKSERGGTGLGLSIASRIIAAHNGRIRVSSMPGSGTSMIIELPL